MTALPAGASDGQLRNWKHRLQCAVAEYLEEHWGATWGEVPQTTVVGQCEGQLRLAIQEEASRRPPLPPLPLPPLPQRGRKPNGPSPWGRKRKEGPECPDFRAIGALLPSGPVVGALPNGASAEQVEFWAAQLQRAVAIFLVPDN